MATLLAYLGPPEHRTVDTQLFFSPYTRWTSMDMTSTKFEAIMTKHNMHEKVCPRGPKYIYSKYLCDFFLF